MKKVSQRVTHSQTAAADAWCLSQIRASICKTGEREKATVGQSWGGGIFKVGDVSTSG